MRKPRKLSVLFPLVGLVVALALVLPSASASTPVRVEVSAVNTDGSQGCTGCELDLEVSGTVIDVPGTGNGNLTGTAQFESASGVKTTFNINESKMVASRTDAGQGDSGLQFVMIQLRDTTLSGLGVPMTVQIRLMPSESGPANIRVRDSLGNLLVQFNSGEYDTEIELK